MTSAADLASLTTAALLGAATTVVAMRLFWDVSRQKSTSNFDESTVPGPRDPATTLKLYTSGKGHHLSYGALEKYGPIFQIDLPKPAAPYIHIADAEAAKMIMTSSRFTRSDVAQRASVGIAEYALFLMPTDEIWKRHRKFLQPAFGPNHLRHGLDASNVVCDELAAAWRKMGSNFEVEMHHVASCITLDVIGKVAYGHDFGATSTYADPQTIFLLAAYKKPFDAIAGRMGCPPRLWEGIGLGVKKVSEDIKIMKDTIRETIESKRKKLASSSGAGLGVDAASLEGMKNYDALDRLLTTTDWSDEEITDEVAALFLAGGETSANTIVNVIYLLDQHPEVREKMVAEIDSVLQDGLDVTNEKLSALTFTECVIKEALRHSPVVVRSVPRYNPEEVTILGHKLAKRSALRVDFYNLHRNPKFWRHPDVFMPSRWLNNFTPVPGSYMPFGDGPHLCLGAKLAMLEIKTVIARLYEEFEFAVVDGQNLETISTVTTGFKNGLKVHVRPRSSN